MKRYLFLVCALLAGTCLQAAESMAFRTVLSKAVGSFGDLQTTTCAYPDVSGSGTAASQQTVINFGPTKLGGQIHLQGGPMKVDTLLMEDGSQLKTGSNVPFLFAPAEEGSEGGKLSIFQNGTVETNALLVNNLILPRNNSFSGIEVNDTLQINWPEFKVSDISLNDLGNHFSVSPSNGISNESGATFHSLAISNDPSHEDSPPSGWYYLYKD